MANIVFGNLSKADGSALIEQDNTIVQASVFGPVDVSQAKVNYEEAVVEIFYKPKVSIALSAPAFDQIREIENLLRAVFKEIILTRLHPRTSILIMVQEIHDSGILLSSSINAVCCALLDAGIAMKSPVSGVTLVQANNTKFDMVFNKNLDILSLNTRGLVEQVELRDAIEKGKLDAKENFDTIRRLAAKSIQ